MKRIIALLLFLPLFAYSMDKSWIPAYLEHEKQIKEKKQKQAAQDLQEITQKVKVEADAAKKATAENATKELIKMLQKTPAHFGDYANRVDELKTLKFPAAQNMLKEIENTQKAQAEATVHIKQLLAAGANPNQKFKIERSIGTQLGKTSYTDTSPLIYALEHRFLPISQLLIEAGADVDFTDGHHKTPLLLAIKQDALSFPHTIKQNVSDIVQLLIERGANPNVPIDKYKHDEETPIITTVYKDHYPLMRLLVQHGADPLWNNHDSYDLAVRKNDIEALRILLSSKDSANVLLSKALYNAVSKNNFDMVKLLLAHGAHPQLEVKVGRQQNPQTFEQIDLFETPLQLALRVSTSSEIINALTNPPTRPAISADQAQTATDQLKEILKKRGYGITVRDIKILLLQGANPYTTVEKTNYERKIYKLSVITYAAENKINDLVKFLLDNGINPDVKDDNYLTLLQLATQNSNHDLIKILLQHGADPDLTTEYDKRTPLNKLTSFFINTPQHINSLKLLLQAGANPNVQDPFGETSLMQVLYLPEAVSLLLQAGADPLFLNQQGKSALMIAQEKLDHAQTNEERAKYLETIEMLNNPQNIKKTGFERIK